MSVTDPEIPARRGPANAEMASSDHQPPSLIDLLSLTTALHEAETRAEFMRAARRAVQAGAGKLFYLAWRVPDAPLAVITSEGLDPSLDCMLRCCLKPTDPDGNEPPGYLLPLNDPASIYTGMYVQAWPVVPPTVDFGPNQPTITATLQQLLQDLNPTEPPPGSFPTDGFGEELFMFPMRTGHGTVGHVALFDPPEPVNRAWPWVDLADIIGRAWSRLIDREILVASAERYRELAESVSPFLYVHDLDGQLTWLNRAARQRLGLGPAESINLNFRDLVVPKYRGLVDEYLRNVSKTGRAEGVMSVHDLSGRRLYLAYASMLTDLSGQSLQVMGMVRDITGQKIAEQALKASEAKYRTVVDHAVEGIAVIQDDVIRFVNQWVLRDSGFSETELLGRPFWETIHPDDAGRMKAALNRSLNQGQDLEPLLVRARHSQGQYGWQEMNGTVIEWEGRPANILFFHDVTARIRSEEALRESEERYRAMTESLTVGICEADLDGRLTYVNPACLRIFGYEKGDIGRGLNILDTISPDESRKVRAGLAKVIRGDRTEPTEYTALCKDGTTKPVAIYTVPIMRAGRPVGLRGSVIDLTDLRRAEAYLAHLLNVMPSAIAATDEDGRITMWNQTMQKATGLSRAKALGCDAYEILAKFGLDRFRTSIEQALTTDGVARVERTEVQDRSGRTIYWDILFSSLGSGPIRGMIIRADDVTKRVKLDEVMVQTEKMASVGALAAGVAHEINNPLSGILQGVQMVKRRLDVSRTDTCHRLAAHGVSGDAIEALNHFLTEGKVLKFLDGIQESGMRAARIVRDLLEYSQKGRLQSTPCDLHLAIDQALGLVMTDYDLRNNYDFKQIEIKRDYSPTLDPVMGDPQQIQQVIINLLKNAAQAVAGAPRRPGFIPTIVVATKSGSGQEIVEITDNGPGVSEADRDRIFEPFFTTKSVGQGTGLGLYVSYGIIQKHGGLLELVGSEPGRTCFRVSLPRLPRETHSGVEARPEKSDPVSAPGRLALEEESS